MLKATSEILKASTKPEVTAVAQPEVDPTVDPDLLKAIDNNDELSYWRENSPALWARAVARMMNSSPSLNTRNSPTPNGTPGWSNW